MKQHITKEQWDELSDKEKDVFKENVDEYRYVEKENKNATPAVKIFNRVILSEELPTIGQMIEFLGDDFIGITNFRSEKNIEVNIDGSKYKKPLIVKKELVDALWEACKYKLKK